MKQILLMAVLFSVLPVSLNAQSTPPQTYPATRLVSDCTTMLSVLAGKTSSDPNKSFQQILDTGMCGGYLRGFADSHSLLGDRSFCVPTQATTEQLGKVFLKYMDQHPEDLHRDAGAMVAAALRNAFPCGAAN